MTDYPDFHRQGTSLTVSSIKRIRGKAVLTLSNGDMIAMPRSMLKERAYRSGMPFDKRCFDTFLNERSYPFAMEKAISLLATRARTEKEITEALRTNAYPEQAIARVMQRLNEAGYINDQDFAENWAASRTSKGLGLRRIRMELIQKGLDSESIDQAFSQLDDDELLLAAVKAAEKAARGKNPENPSDRQKILAALVRRGFDFSIAKDAISRIMTQD